MTQEKKSVIIQSEPPICRDQIKKSPEIQIKPIQRPKNELAIIMSQTLKANFQAYCQWVFYLMAQSRESQVEQRLKNQDSTPVIILIDQQPEKGSENKIIQKQSVVESNRRNNAIEKQKQIKTKNSVSTSKKPLKKEQKTFQKTKNVKKVVKQNLTKKLSQISNQKSVKSKPKESQIQVDLVDCIHIKNNQIADKQMTQKKQGILKRTVVDWNFIDKNRSERRQLRMLNN